MSINSARFSGHQSFTLRNTWLTKGVLGCEQAPSIFRQPDAIVSLGVGKNMVEAIKYWCLATRMIEDHPEERFAHRPSPMGRKIFVDGGGWDPYLEDVGTLWLLHWLLATNAEWATTIAYAFNELPELEFSREALLAALAKRAALIGARATPETLRRDLNVMIRTYVGGRPDGSANAEDSLDCPLAELDLLYEEPLQQTIAFARGPKDTLPTAIFCYALHAYARARPDQPALAFDELAYNAFSPGRVFKLDEAALAEQLDRAAEITHGDWQMTETAGYRQLMLRREVDPFPLLEGYYSGAERGRDG